MARSQVHSFYPPFGAVKDHGRDCARSSLTCRAAAGPFAASGELTPHYDFFMAKAKKNVATKTVKSPERAPSIGGLWLDTDRNGRPYMNGRIAIGGQIVRVFALPGDKSVNAMRPDWSIFVSKPLEPKA